MEMPEPQESAENKYLGHHMFFNYENDVCRQNQEVQKRQRHRAKAPVENIEDHYRVNHFLLYIDHSIYIHSRFPD
jgi:hypothetical protein